MKLFVIPLKEGERLEDYGWSGSNFFEVHSSSKREALRYAEEVAAINMTKNAWDFKKIKRVV